MEEVDGFNSNKMRSLRGWRANEIEEDRGKLSQKAIDLTAYYCKVAIDLAYI